MLRRIVITGVGVVSSIGIGKAGFWRSLYAGNSGVGAISLFSAEPYPVKHAAEARGFNPQQYFTKKELINFDRATSLIVAAAKLALEDAQLKITEENTHSVGICVGTTFGSLKSLSDFDIESFKKGPQLVNPSRFPNTVANLPASQVAIYFKIKGFNATISTGMCAGLDALDYGLNAIQYHRRTIVLTGALEEMCEQTFLGFYRLKMLACSKNDNSPLSCPFDHDRNGIVLGEGSSMVILEDLESAQKRAVSIYAEILSTASNVDPFRLNRYNPKATGMIQVMRLCLQKAQLAPEDIDCICANANSTPDADLAEGKAIGEVFGRHAQTIPVTSIKAMVGETYSASGGLASVAAVGMMQNHFVAPIINYQTPDPRINLNLVLNKAQDIDVNTVMINAFGVNGANSCLILRKFKNE